MQRFNRGSPFCIYDLVGEGTNLNPVSGRVKAKMSSRKHRALEWALYKFVWPIFNSYFFVFVTHVTRFLQSNRRGDP